MYGTASRSRLRNAASFGAFVQAGHVDGPPNERRFVEDGLDAALSELVRPGADRKLAEKEEALLIATACSAPPAGRAGWTLELLAGEMVRLTKHVRDEPRHRKDGGRARSLRREAGQAPASRVLR